jgi:hypothetical protein
VLKVIKQDTCYRTINEQDRNLASRTRNIEGLRLNNWIRRVDGFHGQRIYSIPPLLSVTVSRNQIDVPFKAIAVREWLLKALAIEEQQGNLRGAARVRLCALPATVRLPDSGSLRCKATAARIVSSQ